MGNRKRPVWGQKVGKSMEEGTSEDKIKTIFLHVR